MSLVGLLRLCLAFDLVGADSGVDMAVGAEVSWLAAFPTDFVTSCALSTIVRLVTAIATSVPTARLGSSGLRAASVLLWLLLPGFATFLLPLVAFLSLDPV